MICLEHRSAFITVVGIDIVILLWWVVVHVVYPALPSGRNLLNHSGESLTVIGVFDPATLVFTMVSEVLIIPVSKLIGSDTRYNFIIETSLLMGKLVRFTSLQSSSKAILSDKLPELWAEHANGHSPRSHI